MKILIKIILIFFISINVGCGKKASLMNTMNLKFLKMNKVYNYNKYLAYEKGKLQIEKISLDKVMKKFHSPLFLLLCQSNKR